MRFRLYAFRWVMLVLYALLLLGLFLVGLATDDEEGRVFSLCLSAGTLLTQLIFIFGAGTRDLLKPVHRKRRLLAPVAVAALLCAILVMAFLVAMDELCKLNWNSVLGFWALAAANWLLWGVFFFIHTRTLERFKVIKRLTNVVLAGSLAELLACIPTHIIVSRRPGCLVGLQTTFGIVAGIFVMLWSFGPGIVLLFLRPKRDAEQRSEATPKEKARAASFSLAGLMTFFLFVSSCLAVLLVEHSSLDSPFTRPEVWCAILFGLLFLRSVLRHVRHWEEGGD